MAEERIHARDVLTVGLQALARMVEEMHPDDWFTIECHDADGHLVWREETRREVSDRHSAQPSS